MQDNVDDLSTLKSVDNKNLIRQNLVYDAAVSQSSTDSSFQLNRLLNFNVGQRGEVEQGDPTSNGKQMLNFSVSQQGEDIGMYIQNKKQRPVRDPLSHRIIEKRRRDRMNNCLADLSQLIPSPYLKQGQGRIEKTEIIEMAIKHIKHLQTRLNALGNDTPKTCCQEKFCTGYEECRDNIMRYLMESLGFQPTESQNMYKYLENQLEKRKSSLPAICTCTGPGPPPPPPISSQQSAAEQATPHRLEIQTSQPGSVPPYPASVDHSPVIHPSTESSSILLPSPKHQSAATSATQNWVGMNVPGGSDKPPPLLHHLVERQNSAGGSLGGQYGGSVSQVVSPRERLTSAPAVCESRGNLPPAHNGEGGRESVLESPAISDTSVTPLVGDEYCTPLPRDSRDRGHHEDSGLQSSISSYTNESNNTESTRSKQECESKNGAYKFKNDIKWRFTANSDKPKESSPDMSRDEKEEFKDPLPLGHSQFGGSGDSVSDFSNGNGSSGNNGDRSSISTGYSSNGNSSNSSIDTSLNNTVPAFALHPMGVYYIPLVLPVSQVMPFMKNHRSMGICHPISIPVSFTGPFHMGVPQVNNSLNLGLGSGYSGDKVHHHGGRHSRHGNTGRRSHGDSNNRSFSNRREVKEVQ